MPSGRVRLITNINQRVGSRISSSHFKDTRGAPYRAPDDLVRLLNCLLPVHANSRMINHHSPHRLQHYINQPPTKTTNPESGPGEIRIQDLNLRHPIPTIQSQLRNPRKPQSLALVGLRSSGPVLHWRRRTRSQCFTVSIQAGCFLFRFQARPMPVRCRFDMTM